MANELSAFVKEALSHRLPRAKIEHELLRAGWPEDEIKTAFAAYLENDFPIPVPKRKPYLSAREAFLYLVMFFTLYTSAISAGTILFQLTNRALPDPLQGNYELQASLPTIRGATAALIITFPVFLLISWLLARAFARNPEKRGSKVRKWLTYVTLFLAAGVILGDLVSLVTSLLGGELTVRFALKALTIFAIAGLIFGNYLWDLRREERET